MFPNNEHKVMDQHGWGRYIHARMSLPLTTHAVHALLIRHVFHAIASGIRNRIVWDELGLG